MADGPRLRLNELVRRAKAVLRGNDEGSFIKPGPRQYPGQWNWDAAFVTMGLAHIDAERGRREVRSLLGGQWADGMVPHIVFHADEVDYFPGPSVWDSPSCPGGPPIPTSGITQPPALAGAVRLLHERSPDRPFLEEVVPRLDAWHRWLHRQRHFDESGLVAIVHPWESGTDDSPRFLPALEALRLEEIPRFERRDRRHVDSSQRPTDLDYRRYVFLLDRLRRRGYRPASLQEAPFAYLDASFNALLVAAEEDLGDLWEEIGQKGGEARARAEGMRAALGAQWDPETGLFRDRDLHGNDGSQETVAGLIPLYAGVPQPHQAARTARAMWDPARFGPSSAFPWAVTSVSKASPHFDPQRYWCGPVWVHVNWLLIRGLQRYRMEAEAEELRRLTLELVERSGFSEYYHPGTGAPLGSGSFCWSASLTIDLLMRPR